MALTHLDKNGKAIMVDISDKSPTARSATATALINMQPETLQLILDGGMKKGDVLASARIAGIMAAKRTAELIPLCHPIPLTNATIEVESLPPCQLRINATVKTTYQTGVEMEALTAVSVAALTVYDMCKAVDRGMTITEIKLLHKSGGKSGEYRREA